MLKNGFEAFKLRKVHHRSYCCSKTCFSEIHSVFNVKSLFPIFNLHSKSRPNIHLLLQILNNLLVYKDLTLPFPSTYAMEEIIHKGKFLNLNQALLKRNMLNNVLGT